MAAEFPDAPPAVVTAAVLNALTLATGFHGAQHEQGMLEALALAQYSRPTINAKIRGCAGDGTTDDSALIATLIQEAVDSGYNIHFPHGTYRCDDGTTATRIEIDFATTVGNCTISGDGQGATIFQSNVTLDSGLPLIEFTNAEPGLAPICIGFSVQGPGTYVDPNTTAKVLTTTNGSPTATGTGYGSFVGCLLTGTGITAGTYIRKVSGTTVTLSANATATGSPTVTIGTGSPNVGAGLRIASSSYTTNVYCGGWYAGYLTSSAVVEDATDHTLMYSCGAQENVYGHYFEDTVSAGTLDYKWVDFRVSRNSRAGVACGDLGHIGSAHMTDCHFNAQPYAFLKEGTYGTPATNQVFIDGLVMSRVKFEGSANRVFHDQTGSATIRGLLGYMEPHGVEINGQKNVHSLTTGAANDHTWRPIALSAMTRAAGGVVTATSSPSLHADTLGQYIAVASALTTGTGDTNDSSHPTTITNAVGFTSADIGKIIVGPDVPGGTIIANYSAGTITLETTAGGATATTGTSTGSTYNASAFHGCYRVASISGSTVTWATTINRAFATSTTGSAGIAGFMHCGTFKEGDATYDFQNDPSTGISAPERRFDIFDAYDLTIRPTTQDTLNFPEMAVRTTSSTYYARKANVVCIQGGMTAWLGKCNAAITKGLMLRPGVEGTSSLDLHPGTTTIPVAGLALQDGGTTAASNQWIWVQTDGFVDGTLHDTMWSCTSPGVAEKWVIIIPGSAAGQVRTLNGDTGCVVVGWSSGAVAANLLPGRLISPFIIP